MVLPHELSRHVSPARWPRRIKPCPSTPLTPNCRPRVRTGSPTFIGAGQPACGTTTEVGDAPGWDATVMVENRRPGLFGLPDPPGTGARTDSRTSSTVRRSVRPHGEDRGWELPVAGAAGSSRRGSALGVGRQPGDG